MDGLGEDGADGVFFEQRLDLLFGFGQFVGGCGVECEVAELAQLFFEWVTEMLAVGGGERAVAEAVVRTFKGDDAFFAGSEQGGF